MSNLLKKLNRNSKGFSVVEYTNQLGNISIFNDIRIAELDEGFVVQDDLNDDETEQTYKRFITFKIVITK